MSCLIAIYYIELNIVHRCHIYIKNTYWWVLEPNPFHTQKKFFYTETETYLPVGELRISIWAKYPLHSSERGVTWGLMDKRLAACVDAECGYSKTRKF